MANIKLFKNGGYVTFERSDVSGYYIVRAYGPSDRLIDKIITDDYRIACEYRRAFNALAKNA